MHLLNALLRFNFTHTFGGGDDEEILLFEPISQEP